MCSRKDVLENVRCVGRVFVPVFQQILDFGNEQTTSIIEFWRSWTISLRVWPTKAVYIAPGPSFNAEASSSSVCGLWRDLLVICLRRFFKRSLGFSCCLFANDLKNIQRQVF